MIHELQAELELAPEIFRKGRYIRKSAPAKILLTGATGFLGTYLLSSLLRETEATIYCIIRCSSPEQGLLRLQRKLSLYEEVAEHNHGRLVAIPGDLARPLLGLGAEQFDELAQEIDFIYHNGAWVNTLHSYATLRGANVFGTQEILRLASKGKAKEVHHISTLNTITPSILEGKHSINNEDVLVEDWTHLQSGYAKSKWVAERLVQAAALRGIPLATYRLGYISGSTTTGASNSEDICSKFIDACLELGCVPSIEGSINMFPVDSLSDYLVGLSLAGAANGQVYNILHPQAIQLRDITECILHLTQGSSCEVSGGEWLSLCSKNPSTSTLASILSSDVLKPPRPANSIANTLTLLGAKQGDYTGPLAPAPVTAELVRSYVTWRMKHKALALV